MSAEMNTGVAKATKGSIAKTSFMISFCFMIYFLTWTFFPISATVTLFEKHIKKKDLSQKTSGCLFQEPSLPPLCQEESVASQKCHLQLKSGCCSRWKCAVVAVARVVLFWCNVWHWEREQRYTLPEQWRVRGNRKVTECFTTEQLHLDVTQTQMWRQ